jgi:3-hydroxypropanoate dehydrogenase
MRPARAKTLVLDPTAQDVLFREARTVSTFTDEPVGDDVLRTVHDLVRNGPTSMNCSPLRAVALRSAVARARLLPHMADANRARTAAAPLVLVVATDHAFTRHMPTLFPHLDADEHFAEPAYRARTAEFNTALQVAYLILGLRAAGLGVGPMSGFDRDGVDAEFFPDGLLRSAVVVLVGRAAGAAPFPRLPRPAFSDVFTTI